MMLYSNSTTNLGVICLTLQMHIIYSILFGVLVKCASVGNVKIIKKRTLAVPE